MFKINEAIENVILSYLMPVNVASYKTFIDEALININDNKELNASFYEFKSFMIQSYGENMAHLFDKLFYSDEVKPHER